MECTVCSTRTLAPNGTIDPFKCILKMGIVRLLWERRVHSKAVDMYSRWVYSDRTSHTVRLMTRAVWNVQWSDYLPGRLTGHTIFYLERTVALPERTVHWPRGTRSRNEAYTSIFRSYKYGTYAYADILSHGFSHCSWIDGQTFGEPVKFRRWTLNVWPLFASSREYRLFPRKNRSNYLLPEKTHMHAAKCGRVDDTQRTCWV